jgi:ubiquinone/menaquinone biosynthesis C-methylase UbiE
MLKKSQGSEVEVQDHVADHYVEKRYKGLGLKYHTRVISEMMEGIHGKILDVGCGVGIISDLYPDHDIHGIDISRGMLRHHKGKCQFASATDIPFDDGAFDSVVCRSVLHHLHEPKKALEEISRVLKPGGRFVCWETNKSWIASIVRSLTQHGDNFSNAHTSFDNLPKLVGEHFHDLVVKYQGFVGYPLYGFPDILDFSAHIPSLFRPCMFLDECLSSVPVIHKLGFAVMIKGRKEDDNVVRFDAIDCR